MGVAYYANYLVWFEVGRTDLIRASGSTYRQLEEDGTILPVIEVHCEYRQPARYDDEIEIRTTGVVLSPIRMKFSYEVIRRADGAAIASGYTVHAALDPKGKPRRLPEPVRREFS